MAADWTPRQDRKSQKQLLGRVQGDGSWRLQREAERKNIYGTSTGAGAERERLERGGGGVGRAL